MFPFSNGFCSNGSAGPRDPQWHSEVPACWPHQAGGGGQGGMPPGSPLWKTRLSGWVVNFHNHPEAPWVPDCRMFRMTGNVLSQRSPAAVLGLQSQESSLGSRFPLRGWHTWGQRRLRTNMTAYLPSLRRDHIQIDKISRSRGEMGHRSEKAVHRKKL